MKTFNTLVWMEDEYLCFGVFVKENIIDEDNNYRAEYRRMYTLMSRRHTRVRSQSFLRSRPC